MATVMRPFDLVLAHPDVISKVVPRNERDEKLIESLGWGFTFHPDEENRTVKLPVTDEITIDWSGKPGYDDVVKYVTSETVVPKIPVAGLAEHLISLRRLINSQEPTIRSGDAWVEGICVHLKTLLDKQ